MTKKQLKQIIKECIRELQLNESRSQIFKPRDISDKAHAFSEILRACQENGVRFYNNYSENISDALYIKVKNGKIKLIDAMDYLVGAIESDHDDVKFTVKKQNDKHVFSINGTLLCDIATDDSVVNIY